MNLIGRQKCASVVNCLGNIYHFIYKIQFISQILLPFTYSSSLVFAHFFFFSTFLSFTSSGYTVTVAMLFFILTLCKNFKFIRLARFCDGFETHHVATNSNENLATLRMMYLLLVVDLRKQIKEPDAAVI